VRPAFCPLGLALMSLLGCGSPRKAAEARHGALGGDAVARVGEVSIPASLVGRVAVAQRLTSAQAVRFLVDDALAANGAHAVGLDQADEIARAITAARARLIALRVREQARAAGRPTDAEVNELTRLHWLQVDLPEQRRVIHAVVLKPKGSVSGADERAMVLANELAAREAQAASPEDFESRAKALVHPADLEIKVEELEPFVADGRSALPGGPAMDPGFAKGAFQLSAVGATSGVVASPFGWHVIRLVEILPERRVPFEDRRRWFKDEAEAMRARRGLDHLEEDLQRRYPIDLANGVDDLMTTATMATLGVGGSGGSPSATP
jgi:hypothetical protein